MSEEAEEILRKRRERNRLAAQRCREKRRSRIEGLEKVSVMLIINFSPTPPSRLGNSQRWSKKVVCTRRPYVLIAQ